MMALAEQSVIKARQGSSFEHRICSHVYSLLLDGLILSTRLHVHIAPSWQITASKTYLHLDVAVLDYPTKSNLKAGKDRVLAGPSQPWKH